MSFTCRIFGYLDVNSFGKFLPLVLSNPTPLEFGRVPCRGSQVSRSSTFNIITPATFRMFAVLTCPDGPEKAERIAVYIGQESCGWTLRVLAGVCRSRTFCFGRRLTIDDFVCRCDFNITGESYRGAAAGCL